MEVKKLKVVQYQKPSPVYEWLGYVGAVSLLAATVMSPGTAIWPALLTGHLLYWNYRLFDLMRKYVEYVNATEISNLLQEMARHAINEHEDGTIPERDGLISREESDETDG